MRTKTILQEGWHRGFKRGISKLPMGRYKEFVDSLQAELGWSKFQVHHFICGRTICRPEQSEKVEEVFKAFRISNIWDE